MKKPMPPTVFLTALAAVAGLHFLVPFGRVGARTSSMQRERIDIERDETP
jgi:hypothetical protein